MNARRYSRPSPTITTYSLTLIGTDGIHTPIGEGGTPKFHMFHEWSKARAAIADVVATVGLDHIHAIAANMVQVYDCKVVDFTATHYSKNEITELCEQHSKPGHSVRRADGQRVNVSIPK